MNLPFFKKTSPQLQKREYLFALEIGHETIKSAIWSIVNQKTQVLSIGEPVAWDESQPDSLVTACDKSLSEATARLDDTGKTQPQKMILGLPADWVHDDKIIESQLQILKNLTHKLSLSAVGFVVTPQALARHLHHVEGVPPTAVLIGFGPTQIEVTLIRLGKLEAVQVVKRSSDLPSDIIEGLHRSGRTDMLPSRILIYDSTQNLEEVRQQLLSYPWQAPQAKLPFLHFPKIETLPPDFSIKAISLSGGNEVAQAIGLIPSVPDPTPATPQDAAVSTITTPQDLGFSAENDIPVQPAAAPTVAAPPPVRDVPPKNPFKLPKIHIHLPKAPRLPLVIIALLILFAGLFAAYWFLPKAVVTLELAPKELNLEFDITLPTKEIEVAISQDQEKNTSGSKLVGDKAVGEITVINGTSSSRQFPAGTVISSPSGLKFSFDAAVEVASASGTADPNSYQPGKATVKVTAGAIGSDSNISAGTQFSVGTFSSLDFIARNEAAFTGGTSRQVAAVSKDDLAALKTQALDAAKAQVPEKLAEKLGAGEQLITNSIATAVSSETYDHKAEEVADKVKVTLSLKASALVYTDSDLKNQIQAHISPEIPNGFTVKADPATTLAIKSTADDAANISVKATAVLLPQVDTAEIIRSLVGKTPQAARDYFQSQVNIKQASFAFKPKLPAFLLTLPRQAKNISVVTTDSQ